MPQPAKERNIPVLFEDECFVAFDKPAGVLVIPSPKKEKNTLVSIVNQQYAATKDSFQLHPCHRLDRETSGVIIFAKGKKNQQAMMQLFHKHHVRKKYIAFIQGKLKSPQGEIRSEIKDFDQKKFLGHLRARLAITRYKVLQIKKKFTVVEVHPITGRTNQIRIQFSEGGFPLLGERKYAFARDFDLKFRRVALHANEVQLVHPIYHKPLTITSPLPADMQDFMRGN